MAPVTNGRTLFNEVPTGFPVPGKTTIHDTSETIDLENVPLNGGFLVKTLVLSIDPYLRGKMREQNSKSYSDPFILGEPIYNYGVGVVLRSEYPSIEAGDHLYGMYPFVEYFIRDKPLQAQIKLENKERIPWSLYVGVCGMPGQTAHHAWKEHAQEKKGDIAFVTSASGPVGATVVQIAKAAGLKVIASAGSDDKVAFVKSIGADVAFNYKTTSTREILEKEGPIDIYWDNVGGETLEAALDYAAVGARFIECGMISGYNSAEAYHVKNLILIVGKQLHFHGFIVGALHPKYKESFYKELPAAIASGQIKYLEDATEGLENAGQAILDVQEGKNNGKKVIIVARD